MSDLIPKINSAIKYSFYAIFFFVPLIMWPDTYELFEFNKMWIVFIFSVFIFFLWGTKSVIEGQFKVRRTPLDVPIVLFVTANIISTIISIDPHTSIWGYYSRFNGGLLSILSYIFLYYAFATNLIPDETNETEKPVSYKILLASLISGMAVTIWGIPSHFGYDPTCFVFRGELNVNCWTEQFKPTIRIFSTLGQPNWMGTFLAVLIPIAAGFAISKLTEQKNKLLFPILYFLFSIFFYIALLWTRSQSSFLGLMIGMVIFTILVLLTKTTIREIPGKIFEFKSLRLLVGLVVSFIVITFVIGTPIENLNKYVTFSGLSKLTQTAQPQINDVRDDSLSSATDIEIGGGTSSGKIRLIVWEGALALFKQNPLIGTGVETYAYAYYRVKPVTHNLTSEWDFLYNKAHNEYLNYAATTGILGLGSYLLIIAFFYISTAKSFIAAKNSKIRPISIGIVAGMTALIVSNFFGFSVVILNLFLFLFPIFLFDLERNKILNNVFVWPKNEISSAEKLSTGRMTVLFGIGIISLSALFYLINFWYADRSYALGYNLNKAGEYVAANPHLTKAVEQLPGEDLYKDELSINLATLAVLFAQQGEATQAAQLGQQAITLSDEVINRHPNNVVYLKTRARVAFALAQLEPRFIDEAIKTIEATKKLAPTDAKLSYNLALFYNQKGDFENTVKYMDEAIDLKPNYIDAYYALGLLYSQIAEETPSKAAEYKQKARENLEYILKNIEPSHTASQELLESL